MFRGRVQDVGAVREAAAGCGAAIHLVGIIRETPPEVTFRGVHVEGTRAVLEACAGQGVKRFVHMSALGTRQNAESEYHRTKYEAEQLVRQSGLAWTIFRPSLIHGCYGEFVRQVRQWAEGKAAPWVFMPYFGRGLLGRGEKALVQPVWVGDVARAFAEAVMRESAVMKTYDLVGAERMTWPEMYRVFAEELRLPHRRALAVPAWYAEVVARAAEAVGLGGKLPFNLSQVQMARLDNVGESRTFTADFGWTPGGMRETVKRYR